VAFRPDAFIASQASLARVDVRLREKHDGAPFEEQNRLEIIGVLDLAGGRAVHARAGARKKYAPVQNAAGWPIDPGNARTLAEVYTQVLGLTEIYAADLDAIVDAAPQEELTRTLATMPAPLWLDAGIRSVNDARRAIDLGAARVIVGLETLPSFDALGDICAAVGSDRVAFSLDLREGQPLVSNIMRSASESPEEIAATAALAGAGALIVIDLTRVGTGSGVDVDLLTRIRAAAPNLHYVAGGGVRGWDDLVDVAKAGCDAALVATALHNGRIGAAEVTAAREL
jgi:phosphoribosylformimino-5-aminoimidazole carboxamide ribotide isomerase